MTHHPQIRMTNSQTLGTLIFSAAASLPSYILFTEGGNFWYIQFNIFNTLLIGGMGGAISAPIVVEKGAKLLSMIPGFITGAGAPAAFILYMILLQRENIYTVEMLLVQFIGALPGILMIAGIIYLVRKGKQ